MILQSLCSIYDVLTAEEDEAPAPFGFSRTEVSFALVLSPEGALTSILDLRSGENLRPQEHLVPLQKSRTSAVFPFFLCDKAEYVLGVEWVAAKNAKARPAKKTRDDVVLCESERGCAVASRRSLEAFASFRDLHRRLLESCDEPGARALLSFLDAWDPACAAEHPKVREYLEDLLSGAKCAFRLERGFLHDNPVLLQVWKGSLGDGNARIGQCLISGEMGPIARTHQAIRGVSDNQAPLVSFNKEAFCSYGQKQSYNAPVSEACAFKYTTALNQLIASPEHRVRIGDTTTVFWAQTGDRATEALIANLLDPPDEDEETAVEAGEPGRQVADRKELALIRDILALVRSGTGIRRSDLVPDPETRCFILGLAPNVARLSIRFFYQDSFGTLVTNLARHHLDLEVDRRSFEPEVLPIYRILRETIPRKGKSDGRKRKEPAPGLSGQLMRAVLFNAAYPVQLYCAILNRVRADQYLNRVRAGVIKAYLLRLARARPGVSGIHEEMITVSLDRSNPNVPYRLGRLFAVLEKAQIDAIGTRMAGAEGGDRPQGKDQVGANRSRKVGASITSRYFGSASSTPAIVFPPLIKLAQHHIAKSEWGWKTTKDIEEIMSDIDALPRWLNLEQQGMFMLGYYHQRQDRYTKKEGKKEEGDADE